jgi:hypothetical protein
MEGITLNKVQLSEIIPENIDICDFRKSKGRTYCRVTVSGVRQDWEITKNKEHSSEEMLKYAIEFSKSVRIKLEQDQNGEVGREDVTNDEVEEIVKDAQPMKRQDPIVRVRKKGFVRGAVVKRKNAFDKDCGYGVLTGDYEIAGEVVLLKMTDGGSYNEFHCELITDVNKQIMRVVAEQQHNIQIEANNFCDKIQGFMNNLIYEEA